MQRNLCYNIFKGDENVKKIQKTNAMRVLDQANISYETYSYPHGKEAVDGIHVAELLNQNPAQVFKTLVTQANTKDYFVFVIPVDHELDLKKCAKAANVKSVEMIPVKEITKVTGYVRGGCSPLAMKKQYQTFIHHTCTQYDTIMFSGGKIGIQICMNPSDLIACIPVVTADLCK